VEFEQLGFFYQDLKCANIVLDDTDHIRFIDLENAGGTEGWAHPDDLKGHISSSYDYLSDDVAEEEWIHNSEFHWNEQIPLDLVASESDDDSEAADELDFQSLWPAPKTAEQRQMYAVYGFGKIVWELFVGGPPTDLEELKSTPEWVQELVNGCCHNGQYTSMSQVLVALKENETLV
jgi:hypothetical protein